MTDPTHPDPYAPRRKGPAADIVDLHDRPRFSTEPGAINRVPPPVAEFTRVPSDPPPPMVETPRSDLEQTAEWVHWLTWGDTKGMAKGMLGDGATNEQVMELADKLHEWSAKARRATR